ncbi:MAG TPA: PQQ-binding-like beta-propeller repeat protein [Chloroflexota bacterium]|nr:PQQ-binding-like beta-propeller repeat protein [Chloroflexota bacterium]
MRIHSRLKRLLTAGAVAALGASIAGAPLFTRAQTGPVWPSYHGNFYRDGSSTVSGPRNPLYELFSLGAPTQDSPVVDANGIAYIGDNAGTVFALNPKDGHAKWTDQAKGAVTGVSLSSDGSTLYFGDNTGDVYAVHTSDGSQIWSINVGAPTSGAPLLNPSGTTMYEIRTPTTILAISTSNGAIQWKDPLDYAIEGSLTLGQNGSVIYVSLYGPGDVAAIPSTGQQGSSQTYFVSGQPVTSPSVDANGNIYVTSDQGVTTAFTPGNGTPRWTASVPVGTNGVPPPSYTTPAVGNGMVYVGNTNHYVYALNLSTGQQVWQQQTGGAVDGPPVVALGNNVVYAGSEDGKIYAFDGASGSPLWSQKVGVGIDTSPALGADGSLWAASTDGTVYRFADTTIPPPVQATATPGAGASPTASPTSTGPTPTATASATLAITSIASSVTPGHTQSITVRAPAGSSVHFRITFPNGQHQNKTVTAGSNGTATYSYVQAPSKVTHSNQTATVDVTDGSQSTSSSFHIKWGHVDVSVEPSTQHAGGYVSIYVHTTTGAKVTGLVLDPRGHYTHFGPSRVGKNGFAHYHYHLPKYLRSRQKVYVRGSTTGHHPNYTTRATLTVK